MLNHEITIINKLGLHTRAAAKLVATAAKFESKIEITRNNNTIDAKSIMGVITLGAARGSILKLTVSGEDELAACDAILALITNRFGEAE
jgi:phosphocarrier protein HPr